MSDIRTRPSTDEYRRGFEQIDWNDKQQAADASALPAEAPLTSTLGNLAGRARLSQGLRALAAVMGKL